MATHMTDVPSGPAAKLLTSSSLLTETIPQVSAQARQHKASAQVRQWYRIQIQALLIKGNDLEVNVRMST